MEKRSKRRRNSEEIQDLGLDLDEEIIDEEDEAEEDLGVEIEEVEEDSIDSDFREMPKVRIDADTGNNGHKHLSSQKGSNQNLKWVLVCILCIVLGVVIYGGYKVFFSGNEEDKTSEINNQKDDATVVENQDTEGPSFIGFLDRVVINLNAVDVD